MRKSSKKQYRYIHTQKGFSLLEVVVSAAILATAVTGSMAIQTQLTQTTQRSNDKAFAAEKVQQMYEELRAHTEGSQETFEESLSNFSDGADYNTMLTTNNFSVNPDDPLSLNQKRDGHWKYVRQVQVEPVENDDFSRRVAVSIWYSDKNGKPTRQRPLASISGILKTNIPKTPPTQVYDFYVLAISNMPSWWSDLYDFKPAYDSVFGDLEFRNPGLNLRKRYITNLGFGRDPFYLPHSNTEDRLDEGSSHLPWAYFYPGKIKATNGGNNGKVKEDFAFEQITGRIQGDEDNKRFLITEKGNTGQYRPYALTDQFNHTLRYPEQLAMEKRLRLYVEGFTRSQVVGNPSISRLQDVLRQPTFTTYLQGLNSGKFRNSILSNMHAELTPTIPGRNYSDAAKIPFDEVANPSESQSYDPAQAGREFMNKRVVTHPERLFYNNTDVENAVDPVRFRVYAYETAPFNSTLDTTLNSGSVQDRPEVDTPGERVARTIPHINVFMPTGSDGELEHPTFSPPANPESREFYRLRKIIGNEVTGYRYRYDKKDIEDSNLTIFDRVDNRNLTASDVESDPDTLSSSPDPNNLHQRYLTLVTEDEYFTDEPSSVEEIRNENVQPLGRLVASSNTPGGPTQLAFLPARGLNSADILAVATSWNFPNAISMGATLLNSSTGLRPGDTFIGRAAAIDNHPGAQLNGRSARNLIGDAIIVGSGRRNASSAVSPGDPKEVAIVTNVISTPSTGTPAGFSAVLPAGTVIITLDRTLSGSYDSMSDGSIADAAWVTRHRDYEISNDVTGASGATRQGVSFNLYNTPTRHGRYTGSGPMQNTGLHENRRLYGMEYLPAPVTTNNTANDITDDFATDLTDNRPNNEVYADSGIRGQSTSSAANRAKNTARWTIGIAANHSAFSSGLAGERITMETRIVGGQSDDSMRGQLNSYIENGVSGDGNPFQEENPSTTALESLLLRPNPYNVSRTYTYLGGSSFEERVPVIEQYQYFGDPRHMPYADSKFREGYNTVFVCSPGNDNIVGYGHNNNRKCNNNQRGFANENNNNMGGYESYISRGKYIGSDVDMDMPKMFRLYNEGILKSNSVYNTLAGSSNYITGVGGGIGQRGNHTYKYKIKNPAPWAYRASDANNNQKDNNEGNTMIAERGSKGYLRFIASVDTANNNNSRAHSWSAFPYLGELFPDEMYGFWKENGNLPTFAYTNADALGTTEAPSGFSLNGGTTRFYRAKTNDTRYNLPKRDRITSSSAIQDFYNGSGDPANNNARVQHTSTGGKGCLQGQPQSAGRYLSDAFNMSLPDDTKSTRPFCINNKDCERGDRANSSHYTDPQNSSRRNTLEYIQITHPDVNEVGKTVSRPSQYTSFYRYRDSNCNGSFEKNTSSSLIKISRKAVPSIGVAENKDLVGYAVLNGMDQGSLFGAQSLSRLAQAATLQAFLEGGDKETPGDASGRIVPMPRLEVTSPDPNLIQSGSSLSVEFDVSWERWDKRPYTPSYPSGWYDTNPVQFNAIYSADNGKTWKFVNSNNVVPPEEMGIYNPNEDVFSTNSFTMTSDERSWSFPWDIDAFADGSYLLRVQVYREGYDAGYSYHQIYFTLKN